jgi:hypothetical protein
MSLSKPRVTALVDGSNYAASVAEHGAFLAGRSGARLQLRHVREDGQSPQAARRLLEDLAERLVDLGAQRPDLSLVEGGVLDAAVGANAEVLVMGKRGMVDARDALGRHVAPIVRAARVPVCLASQVFLPVHRVLTVTDADPARRAALDLVSTHAGFDDVELDCVVVSRPGETPEEKLAIARQALEGRAQAFAIHAERLGEAVWRYLAERPTDLIVISRAVLLGAEGPDLRAVRPGGLWSARASVLIC